MGLFDSIKNLFNSRKGTTQTSKAPAFPEDYIPKIDVSFSSTPLGDESSPNITPLEVLLKRAASSKRGLYPHEILMLDYAHTFSTKSVKSDFQEFWYYQYSVKHPEYVLKSLESRHFISPGDLQSTIQRLTVAEIRQELKAIGQKVSEKKSDLVARLLANADQDALSRKFPTRYYALTPMGQQELEENPYVSYLHRHRYMSVWEMNYRLANNPKHLDYRDIIWQFLNEESVNHFKNGDMGLYRNTRLEMYQLLMETAKYNQAFQLLCEVIAYDLSGMGNNEFDLDDLGEDFRLHLTLEHQFPYGKPLSTLPPAIKRWLAELQSYLNFSDDELRQHLLQQFESIHLYRRLFTNSECVDIVMAELSENTPLLEKIYRKGRTRVKEQLNGLHKSNKM